MMQIHSERAIHIQNGVNSFRLSQMHAKLDKLIKKETSPLKVNQTYSK